MSQGEKWESEYRKPKLVTKDDAPQADTLKFVKWLRKEQGLDMEGLQVLDIGSGTGRNSNHLAGLGAKVTGLEISDTALRLAEERAKGKEANVRHFKHDIGAPYPLEDGSFDVALDVMSSNSLSEDEREICASEIHRVLKPGGWLYMKALCKDGDKNAQNLIKKSPGREKDTYVIPEWGLQERVWSRDDFMGFYGVLFDVIELEKKTNYATYSGRKFKRNYWVAYLRNR